MADGGASWFEQSREEARLESAFKAFLRTSPEVSATLPEMQRQRKRSSGGGRTARRAAVPSSSSLKTRSSGGGKSKAKARGRLHAGSRRRTTKKKVETPFIARKHTISSQVRRSVRERQHRQTEETQLLALHAFGPAAKLV